MGEVIVVVSGKGGVGKTTFAANIGAVLAREEKKVLLIDADVGLRNLDIILGTENKVVYDVADVLDGVCDIEEAVLPINEHKGLYFITSPQTRSGESVTPEKFSKFCRELALKYDYIIIDGPAGVGNGFFRAIKDVDRAIVVTQPFMSAIRDADRTISILEREGISDISVVINGIRAEMVEDDVMLNADYILDILGTALLGIIPYDEEVLKAASESRMINNSEASYAGEAFSNIAKRISGEKIPIMDFNKKKKKRKWFSLFKA